MVKAIRYPTVDIIEDIVAWKGTHSKANVFKYNGSNYFTKIKCDLDFLDLYDEITEYFGFSFKSNPLGYKDGGSVISGRDNFSENAVHQAAEYNRKLIEARDNTLYVDGLDIYRLQSCELELQKEFNWLAKQPKLEELLSPHRESDNTKNNKKVGCVG